MIDVAELLASVPTPSADEMLRRRSLAQSFTLIFFREGQTSRADEAQNERVHEAHQQHLTKLQQLGKLSWNGPILVEHDLVGVSVYTVELEEALALAQADPKVKAGYLTVEAIPWMAVPGDQEN